MNYFDRLAGSPLLSPELVTIYLVAFSIILLGIYLYLHFNRRDLKRHHKLKALLKLGLILKVAFLLTFLVLAAYWLVPAPHVKSVSPAAAMQSAPINKPIAIEFDRPLSRQSLSKSITPEVPGVWLFENRTYATHLYRKAVFYPDVTLDTDTTYTVKLENIKNLAQTSKPSDYQYSFRTQESPRIIESIPPDQATSFNIDREITLKLSAPNDQLSEFNFDMTPPHPIETVLDAAKTSYAIKPKEPWKQGTAYRLKTTKTDVNISLSDETIVSRKPSVVALDIGFKTTEAPGIASFSPTGGNIFKDAKISMSFSQPMDRKSVEANFVVEPGVTGAISWVSDTAFEFKPTAALPLETTFAVKVKKGAKSQSAGFLEQDAVYNFTTIGRVRVASFNPGDGWTGLALGTQIRVAFNQEVDRGSAQSKFSLSPSVPGSFSWEGNTLVFSHNDFSNSTRYVISVASGVRSVRGLDSSVAFSSGFTTKAASVKLAVPAYLQKYSLSCEVAALRMALAYRGVGVSEDTLLAQLGVDPTPHVGNTWGNPYVAFVGDVRGRQMTTGYGTYWGPIARVASNYRSAQAFSGWGVGNLTAELAAGNPVVIWGYSSGGRVTYWNTPDGQRIYAVSGEHTVTAVGFVGPQDNPSQIIVNDPLVGQVYWSRATFNNKWGVFGNSGVVVR